MTLKVRWKARRTVIYTLDFEMKISMYKSIATAGPVITQYDIDNLQMNGDLLFEAKDSAAVKSITFDYYD